MGAGALQERRRAHPASWSAAAFRSRPLRHGTLLSFGNTATTSSTAVLATVFLQERLGIDPIAAGLTLMALSVAVILTSTGSRSLLKRMSAYAACEMGIAAIALGAGWAVAAVVAAATAVWCALPAPRGARGKSREGVSGSGSTGR